MCVPVVADPERAGRCLDSLARSEGREQIEVVVMANGLLPEDRRILEERDDVVVVRSGTNLGFAGGNNRAAEVARGRYLLLLNDDSTVESDCVGRLVATAEHDRTIGAVGGRILSDDGTVQEAGSVLWNDGWATHVGAGLPGDTLRYFYVRDTDYCSANGLLVRKEAWDAVGGLEERYHPAYFEDADLCMKLRRSGYRIVHEPRARLTHLEGQSTSRRYRNFLLRRNRLRFLEAWGPELACLPDRPAVPDEVAIERAVCRARGSPPRVLLALGATTSENGGGLRAAAEQLAQRGWAVTVVPTPSTASPSLRTERLVDLGVDIRDDIEETLATVGTDFEAVVTTRTAALPHPVIRPDGSPPPAITVSSGGETGPPTISERVARVARRGPVSPRPSPVTSSFVDGEQAQRGSGVPGAAAGVGDLADGEATGALAERARQAERELRAVTAELEVKNEYIADLEGQVDALSARLHAFPQERIKIWVARRLRRAPQ